MRINVKQYLRFTLPKGATLWSVFVAGKPVKPAKDKNGSVLVPLEKSQLQGESLTRFPVELVYLDEGSKMQMMGQLRMDLPRTDIPVSAMHWNVYFPNDYTYFKFGGNVKETKERFMSIVPLDSVQRAVSKSMEQADQIGTQFRSQSTTQLEPYYSDQSAATGKLPIKIDVPQQGRHLRFSKLLVIEKESPWLSLYYSSIPHKLSVPFRLIFLVILVLFFGGQIIKKIRHKQPR